MRADYLAVNNTTAYYVMAWISFVCASAGMLWGIWQMPLEATSKVFMSLVYLFTVSSCFTLAKVIRDRQESSSIVRKIEQAKTEKLINQYTGEEL